MRVLQRIDHVERLAIVTAGLGGAGAVLGAVCAAASVAGIALLAGGVHAPGSAGTPALLCVAAAFGSLVGAVGAPILGWSLLRRVPLGRVLAVTTIGTVAGAVVGEQLRALDPFPATLPGVIAGALLGFLLSGIVLRVHAKRCTGISIADVH